MTTGLKVLRIALPLLVIAVIWIPQLREHYVPNVKIARATLEDGRRLPAPAILEEVRKYSLHPRHWRNDAEVVSVAEKLLKGRAEVPGYEPMDIVLPFRPSELTRGSNAWQLQYAGLIIPEIFLDAYRLTGREEFYINARDSIVAWARYERRAWLDHGFLWNDHAVATRVRTLADFWSLYRGRSDFQWGIAQIIWEFAARTGEMLAKPEEFTFATNHGVMQNLALWQLCVAFPSLPQTEEYKRLALARLTDQFAYYVGPDGMILENSAGYHEFGLNLLSIALRYATLLKLDIPPEWARKYQKAKAVYAELAREDGSLPILGDTDDRDTPAKVLVGDPDASGRVGPLGWSTKWRPLSPAEVYAVSGNAVFWEGLENWPAANESAQTVLAWSYFPGHGHKHADDLTVLLRGAGQDWWTESGYWSYDDVNRERAECWGGSNAPHLVGERCNSERTSSLVSYFNQTGLWAVQMKRQGPSDFVVNRLVIHASGDVWVVADVLSGARGQVVRTVWTTRPEVHTKREANSNELILSAEGVPKRLKTYLWGTPQMKVSLVRGSRTPFAGWVWERGSGRASDAIIVEQSADGAWALAVWKLESVGETTTPRAEDNAAPTLKWEDGRNWSIYIPESRGARVVSRQGETIAMRTTGGANAKDRQGLLLSPPPDAASQIADIRDSFKRAASHYKPHRDLMRYRLRALLLVVGLFVLQELAFLVFRKLAWRFRFVAASLVLVSWLFLGVWLQVFYLAVP